MPNTRQSVLISGSFEFFSVLNKQEVLIKEGLKNHLNSEKLLNEVHFLILGVENFPQRKNTADTPTSASKSTSILLFFFFLEQ